MQRAFFLKKETLWLFLSLILTLAPIPAFADQADLTRIFQVQRRLIDDEFIRELRGTEEAGVLKEGEKIKFESGGLLSNIYRLYRNLDNDSSVKDTVFSILSQEIWIWGKMSFPNGNYVYIRGRDAYSQKQNSSIYSGIPAGGDHEGPALDNAYFSLKSGDNSLNIGRQYFMIGRGIAYGDTNDGILINSYSPKWILKGFLSHSLPHEDNVDYSVPGYDKDGNDRYFWGVEAGYMSQPNNAIYAFYLMQKDNTKPHPDDATQNYHYNSQYFGLGFVDKKDQFSSWGEIIKEIGSSYTDSTQGPVTKKPVDAWAAILGARYEFDMAFQPSTEVEFAFGSGDKDRSNVTNTKNGGNIRSKDCNFLYFGNYSGGYALSPRLSNLLIYKIDQSLKPFYASKIFKDLTIGAKFFAYFKDKKDAGISDTEATNNKRFVGTEADLYLYWTIIKDLEFIFRYGIFFPGNAYLKDTDNNTNYLFTRLTYMF